MKHQQYLIQQLNRFYSVWMVYFHDGSAAQVKTECRCRCGCTETKQFLTQACDNAFKQHGIKKYCPCMESLCMDGKSHYYSIIGELTFDFATNSLI